ncbi:2,3-diaminopropionate biosynthesis protein SbnB [Streptomyces rimosus]|uniref:2,3-diaminopropionate biosynthesis protein SbnB n=1 Tax=Streptomyces rimosus TaxID=1927 RepID=UPI0004CA685D|nr:2,3-diaminopropionate biosynthesis protein SbnB [Streptomyces rimosus]
MLIARHADVHEVLAGREEEILAIVQEAYEAHEDGRTAVPHSTFLRFPGDERNRIIGLPAFTGGDHPVAGMKWIASFPGNLDEGLPRASAAIVLNSLDNGFPVALVEGSQISAKRTAASAALAARLLTEGAEPTGVTLVGGGVINTEVLRFLLVALPTLREVTVFDLDAGRAEAFAARCRELGPRMTVEVAADRPTALARHGLVALATTSSTPHLGSDELQPGTVVLHVSLRDLYPEVILGAHNIVDDADHVCRERTSLHLAEQAAGHREFIHASIGALVRGTAHLTRDPGRVTVFSPFGLGILDLALAEYVRAQAAERGLGVHVEGFLGHGAAESGR